MPLHAPRRPDLRAADDPEVAGRTGFRRITPRTMLRAVRLGVGLFVLFLVVGNAVIAAAWQLQSRVNPASSSPVDGVSNLHVVDDRVWRSAAPSRDDYEGLAAAGVRTIVDLRAEEGLSVDTEAMSKVGIEYVSLPIRDGQIPNDTQVGAFLHAVDESKGITLVHCGAGVGRTGSMAAAYLVETGAADARTAMRLNLSVGPPSLEQLAFAARLDRGIGHPPALIVAASRVLDAPRRLWSRYGL
jgi:protein-tyrosine phosphatase